MAQGVTGEERFPQTGVRSGRVAQRPPRNIAVRAMRITWLLALFALTFLAALDVLFGASFYLLPGAVAIAAWQTLTQDVAGLLAVLAALPAAWLLARRQAWPLRVRVSVLPQWRIIAGLTAFAFLAVAAGAAFVMRGFPLSMDEFSAWFQAQIFLNGDVLAAIDSEWNEFAKALQPSFIAIESGLWGSVYRPVNAFLLAVFERAGAGLFMNAVFASLCVWLVAAIARQIWPHERWAPVFAAGLLAVAPQFLVTAMTPYAMTGHLLASLLWVWLFLRDRPWSHALAMMTGAAAMGLHQIHIHVLIALPFLFWLGWRRRWGTVAAYGTVYGLAFLLWSNWWHLAQSLEVAHTAPVAGEGAAELTRGAGRLVQREFLVDLIAWPLNLARFLSWQNLALVPLLIMAWLLRRDAPVSVRLLFWSAVALLSIHFVLMPGQGHGWGYRYLHPVLGHISLLAAFGWLQFRQQAPEDAVRRFGRAALTLAGLTAAVLLPLRLVQAANAVRPMERSVRFLQSLDADVVLIDGDGIHIGRDLMRNDPYLNNRPKLIYAANLSTGKMTELCARYRVRFVDQSDLRRFGIPELPESARNRDGRRDELVRRLREAGCPVQVKPVFTPAGFVPSAD